MDGRRFDSLARSMARWSTRRKFLTGLTGAAAASGALVNAGGALAQTGACNPSGAVMEECSKFSGSDSNANIAAKSNDLLTRQDKPMPLPSKFPMADNPHWDRPQLPEFVGQIRCILEQGAHANDNGGWLPEQRNLFMSQVRGVITAVSIGFTGGFFTGPKKVPATPTDSEPNGVHALLAQDAISNHPSGCTSNALTAALVCWHDCDRNSNCYSKCFIDFVEAYFIGSESDPACAPTVEDECDGDCCGVCVP